MIQREGKPSFFFTFKTLFEKLYLLYFSEPAELLLAMEASASSKGRFAGDGGPRPSRADVVEQWARQSSGHAQRLSSSIQRRGSDSLGTKLFFFSGEFVYFLKFPGKTRVFSFWWICLSFEVSRKNSEFSVFTLLANLFIF